MLEVERWSMMPLPSKSHSATRKTTRPSSSYESLTTPNVSTVPFASASSSLTVSSKTNFGLSTAVTVNAMMRTERTEQSCIFIRSPLKDLHHRTLDISLPKRKLEGKNERSTSTCKEGVSPY